MSANSLRSLFAVLVLALSFAAPAPAQAPEEIPELSNAVARRLLALSLEVLDTEVDVAYVLDGEKSLKKGFSSRSAAVVIYLATKLEDGHRRRRCHEQIFLYTPEFGWFLEEVVQEPFRDYLRIWSETRGYFEIK